MINGNMIVFTWFSSDQLFAENLNFKATSLVLSQNYPLKLSHW